MDAAEVTKNAEAMMKKASDDAHRARLAFVTGNYQAYIDKVFADAEQRLTAEYDELDGPRAPRDTGTV